MKMYNRLGRLLVVASLSAASIGFVLASEGAHAAQQFWVSLGSYSQLSGAQQMHARARGSFSQLSVVPSESTIGFVYRVVDGPVYSRAEADDRLQRARFAGFLDAWLFIKDESFVMPQGLSETELAAGAPINPDPLLADDQYGYGLSGSTSDAGLDSYSNEYRSDYDNQGAINATEEYSTTPSVGEQTLVETAPPGYGLHQLRRAGPATGAGERGSRLRALDDLVEQEPPEEPDSAQ